MDVRFCMKISFFGVAAVIVAIVGSAFAISGHSPQTLYSFSYNGPIPAQVSDVMDENNYTFIGQDKPNCNGLQQRACQVNVPAAYVSGTTLLSTTNIHSTKTGTNAEIIGVAAGSFSNRPD